MRLPDVNLLLYAVNTRSPLHGRAREWLERRLSETEPVGLAWSTMNAFVRLSTKVASYPSPLSPTQAFGLVEGWLARPNVVVIHPTERHLRLMRELLNRSASPATS